MLRPLRKLTMEPVMCALLHESEINKDVPKTSLDLVVRMDGEKTTFSSMTNCNGFGLLKL